MKKGRVYIKNIETSVPDHLITQEQMMDDVKAVVPQNKKSLAERLYRNSGIAERYSVLDGLKGEGRSPVFIPESAVEYPGPPTSERNRIYSDESGRLAVKTARALFNKEESFSPERITHLITASCTGFSAPGFDIALVKELGMRQDVQRLHIGFMGCLAAFPALRTAASACAADRDSVVLIVCSELCSLHYRHFFDAETLVSNSLFADGCSAALVISSAGNSGEKGITLEAFDTGIIEKTESKMGWEIGDNGFMMGLSPEIPGIISEKAEMMLEKVCRKAGIKPGAVKNWAVHPGGRAILDRICAALGLEKGDFDASYSVLRDFGNMSSATALFVLERLLRSGAQGHVFAAAFGPGLSYETAVLELV